MSGPRKRISRACDSCNALRTKCNGLQPCQHCVETATACEFKRLRKKRGKAARRELGADSDQAPAANSSDQLDLPFKGPASSSAGRGMQGDRPSFSPMTDEWAVNVPSAGTSPFGNGHTASVLQAQYPVSMQMSSRTLAAMPLMPPERPPPGRSVSQAPYLQGPGPHLDHLFNLPQPVDRQGRDPGIVRSDLRHLNKISGPGIGGVDHSSPFGLSPRQFDRGPVDLAAVDSVLKYPILYPHLNALGFMPTPVLNDLLETYFDNSPYVFAYVLRRCDVLHRTSPRETSSALLYAILCVAAHTCENSFFSSSPVSRARAVQRLFEMSVTALRPLQHDEVGGGGLDDVLTYTQLGTIIAVSEFKGVSLRWYHSAWTLATELRLNRELSGSLAFTTTETVKEERRRTWWLLYMIDRHLCLCYNRPLCLSDIECEQLFHPIDETIWASDQDLETLCDTRGRDGGDQNSSAFDPFRNDALYAGRARGLVFQVLGSGIFGFWLPLTTILGEICTLTMLSRSSRLSFESLEPQKEQIRMQLDEYMHSLTRFEQEKEASTQVGPDDRYPNFTRHSFLPYARQLMHTMHILLCGKWDPILLMEDKDHWISSQEFVSAATHAVSAAEATTEILRIDPDLAFMPCFFGIYLLQGSFLLLMIVDKLEQAADESVIQAAETYIRAHEVCVATLDTQYQRNFRKVLRSTLNSIRQQVKCSDEEKAKRKEILALYRWANDGRGLVI